MGCQAEQETGGAGLYAPAITASHTPSWKGGGRECPKGNDLDRAGM